MFLNKDLTFWASSGVFALISASGLGGVMIFTDASFLISALRGQVKPSAIWFPSIAKPDGSQIVISGSGSPSCGL